MVPAKAGRKLAIVGPQGGGSNHKRPGRVNRGGEMISAGFLECITFARLLRELALDVEPLRMASADAEALP
jgi:hypothetical protein